MSEPDYRDRLKSTIVEVARSILSEEGLPGLQARRIARAADCSVGTIYNLYGNLDMIAIAANALTLGELRNALLREQASEAAPVGERLQAMARTYVAFALEHQAAWRAVFEHRMTGDLPVPNWYREAQADLFEIVEEAIAEAVSDANRRREVARALFAAVHGVLTIALDEKLGDFDQESMERQVNFVVAAIARNL